MSSSAKIWLGILIWAAGLAGSIAILTQGSDEAFWMTFIPAAIVGALASWLGGYFVAESWRPDLHELGDQLVNYLRHERKRNRRTWIHFGICGCFAIGRRMIENGGLLPYSQILRIVFMYGVVAAIIRLAERRFEQLELPTGGFAIHEFGIRLPGRTILYSDIAFVRIAETASKHIRLRVKNEMVLVGHPDLTEQEIEDALSLISDNVSASQHDPTPVNANAEMLAV